MFLFSSPCLFLGQSYMGTLILSLLVMGISTNQQRIYFFAGYLRLAMFPFLLTANMMMNRWMKYGTSGVNPGLIHPGGFFLGGSVE